MATNEKVKTQLANRANGQAPTPTPEQTIAAYMKKMAPRFAEVLPKHMDIDRMTRIALTTIRTNPKLLEASVPSLLGAIMQAAQLGLEPGLVGHCYLVPFKNGKTGQTEVQFIIGYKGMIDLARRSGNIESIYAHAVYENDTFEYEYGLHPKLVHKPAMTDRGEFIGAYAVAHFKDGGYQFEFMPKEEIEKRRNRSKTANGGPWVTDYEEMAKKTVVRHMWKYLPISIEIQQAAAQDEVIRKDVTSEPEFVDDVIDISTEIEEQSVEVEGEEAQ
ncbi:recombination protein RecT [Tepidibacillus fermentans]|uniref:Recombination protein RecT n=1 Tax=Tepidibacillus fermentans TaxID=1281767 RepID=A0A4R3KB45_9BACI|nr:recombination protein RecT [Tepidibacillus fermentans]TCS80356.1 recombination protein RecT [Tepidibacillus fermentans]